MVTPHFPGASSVPHPPHSLFRSCPKNKLQKLPLSLHPLSAPFSPTKGQLCPLPPLLLQLTNNSSRQSDIQLAVFCGWQKFSIQILHQWQLIFLPSNFYSNQVPNSYPYNFNPNNYNFVQKDVHNPQNIHKPNEVIAKSNNTNAHNVSNQEHHLSNQDQDSEAHIHPHLHEHHQVLYPNNLATHMMAVKVSWYRATRSVIEISAAIFLIMGTVIFMTGFLKLLWARTALTSIQAGSYMIGSFLTISSATLG